MMGKLVQAKDWIWINPVEPTNTVLELGGNCATPSWGLGIRESGRNGGLRNGGLKLWRT